MPMQAQFLGVNFDRKVGQIDLILICDPEFISRSVRARLQNLYVYRL